jgi:4-hydroxybutyrate CoA-transferase
MKIVSARDAIAAIPDGSRVMLPHGAVEPTSLYEALQVERERFRALRLYSGMQFGDYAYLREGLGENFAYATWQASPRLRPLFRAGRIELLPLRFRDVVRVVAKGGSLPPDVAVIQVSPPRDGAVSLGISVSLFRDFAASAELVIAEINSHMPWTAGAAALPVDEIDLAVESDLPLGTYRSPRRSERDARIVEHVLEQIPDGAWVQLGVGAVPDAVLHRLHELRDIRLHSGMLTDGLIDFVSGARHDPRVVTGEVAGSAELYEFVGLHPQIEFHPSRVTHDLIEIAALPRFTAINSAVEVDLHGQVNGESVDGTQISGVGGSLDFVEAAAYSAGGRSIVALPSTTEDGSRSKIVARLSERTPVTIPRFCTDVVITEHGIAHLRGKTLRERAEALIAVADPKFRDELEAARE